MHAGRGGCQKKKKKIPEYFCAPHMSALPRYSRLPPSSGYFPCLLLALLPPLPLMPSPPPLPHLGYFPRLPSDVVGQVHANCAGGCCQLHLILHVPLPTAGIILDKPPLSPPMPPCVLRHSLCYYPLQQSPVIPPIPQTFLPLLLLGIVFSSIFLATRNLLPPMILHSAWNIFVLYNLLFRPA